MISLFKPYMGDEEIEAISEVLQSGWIGLGPKTAMFEEEFAKYIGVKFAVGVNSATAALDIALKLLRVNFGDEVIVPTITFVSTAHVVAYNLATPIFVDVDEKTMNLSLDDVEKKLSKRTKAIIPVHYSGRPVDIDALKEVVGKISIIEDAAHACGALYKGKHCGALGDMGCFSFHAVKNLAMGDGGAITLNNHDMSERAKRLRWLGIDKTTWDRTDIGRTYWWQYFVDEIGLKCHMNDLIASIGLVQLRKLEDMNQRRREIVKQYDDAFKTIDWIIAPPGDDDEYKSSWHIYWIRVPKRDELTVYLKDAGIITGVHYYPIHLYRCYGNIVSLPVAEKLSKEIVSLPMHPGLTDDDVEKVIQKIIEFGKKKL